jgi:hypothetical protein
MSLRSWFIGLKNIESWGVFKINICEYGLAFDPYYLEFDGPCAFRYYVASEQMFGALDCYVVKSLAIA